MKEFLRALQGKKPNEGIDPNAPRYAGMNVRTLANMLDFIILMMLMTPLLYFMGTPKAGEMPMDMPPAFVEAIQLKEHNAISDEEFQQKLLATGYIQNVFIPKMVKGSLINLLVFGVVYIFFWKKYGGTPGKIVFGLKVAREKDLGQPSMWQYIVRFFGYVVAGIPFFIGFFIIPLNKKKRGLHDYMAGTVVIYKNKLDPVLEKKKMKWKIYLTLILLIISIIYLGKNL